MTDPRHDLPADDGADEALDPTLLADLRQAWLDLPAPEATPDLDEGDALTRDVVSWMAQAYQAQQPAVGGPSLPVRHRWRLGWRRWRRQAVAAALLIGLGVAVALGPDGRAPASDDGPRHVAESGEAGAPGFAPVEGLVPRQGPGGDLVTAEPAEPAPQAAPPTDSLTPAAPDEPRLVAVADDHVSFRAGAVRLVLITNPASAE